MKLTNDATTTRQQAPLLAALSLQAPRPFLSEKNKDFPFGPNDQADLKIGICFRHREFSVNTVILPGKILHIYSIHGQKQSNNESRSWHINKKIPAAFFFKDAATHLKRIHVTWAFYAAN